MASSLNGTGVTFSDGSSQSIAWVGPRAQLFTSSGTFTVPAGVSSIKVTVVGGGGGSTLYWGSNGANGGACQGIYTVTPGAAITVTVGAGGAGATANNTPGGAGGTSSFGALASATGGAGASNTSNPTPGDSSSGNIYNYSVRAYSPLTTAPPAPFVGLNRRAPNSQANAAAAAVWSPTLRGSYPGYAANTYNNFPVAPGAAGCIGSDGGCVSYTTGGAGGAVLVEW